MLLHRECSQTQAYTERSWAQGWIHCMVSTVTPEALGTTMIKCFKKKKREPMKDNTPISNSGYVGIMGKNTAGILRKRKGQKSVFLDLVQKSAPKVPFIKVFTQPWHNTSWSGESTTVITDWLLLGSHLYSFWWWSITWLAGKMEMISCHGPIQGWDTWTFWFGFPDENRGQAKIPVASAAPGIGVRSCQSQV